jgi:hypothetical protein
MLCDLLSVTSTVILSQTRDDDPARTRGQSCHFWELRIAPQSRSGQSQADGAYQAWRSEEVARIEARYLENGLLIQLCQRFSACSGE